MSIQQNDPQWSLRHEQYWLALDAIKKLAGDSHFPLGYIRSQLELLKAEIDEALASLPSPG